MSPLKPTRLFATVGLASLTLTLAGCDATAPAQDGRTVAKAATRVEVARPARATVRRTVEQPGQIEAAEVAPLHAKVAGFVEKWLVDIGARVKKGQELAVLAVPELDAEAAEKQAAVEEAAAKHALAKASIEVAEADLAAARAKLEEVRSGIKRAEADLARWQAEAKRVEQLFTERALTGSLLDETRSKLHVSEAAREELTAQVLTAEAGVKQALALRDRSRASATVAEAAVKVAALDVRRVDALRGYARIVAPFDGVVTRRTIEVGQLTDPAPKGEPLFVVSRVDLLKLVVGVPEMAAAAVPPRARVLVRLQALGGTPVEGTVSRTAVALDTHSRTLRVEVDLPNLDGRLRPGLFANAAIVVEEHPDVLTVPTSALVRDGTKTACVVVTNGKANRVPVTLGLDDGTRAEILAGMKGDELVVQAGAGALAEGQAVEVVEPSKKKAGSFRGA